MLIQQLLNEARAYDVLGGRIETLLSKRETEALSKDEMKELKVLRDIKKNDIWETSGSKVPTYGPSLSSRLSANRELVLFKRSDGRIVVVQCSDSDNSADDKTLATFANSEVGYNKALDFFISRNTK